MYGSPFVKKLLPTLVRVAENPEEAVVIAKKLWSYMPKEAVTGLRKILREGVIKELPEISALRTGETLATPDALRRLPFGKVNPITDYIVPQSPDLHEQAMKSIYDMVGHQYKQALSQRELGNVTRKSSPAWQGLTDMILGSGTTAPVMSKAGKTAIEASSAEAGIIPEALQEVGGFADVAKDAIRSSHGVLIKALNQGSGIPEAVVGRVIAEASGIKNAAKGIPKTIQDYVKKTIMEMSDKSEVEKATLQTVKKTTEWFNKQGRVPEQLPAKYRRGRPDELPSTMPTWMKQIYQDVMKGYNRTAPVRRGPTLDTFQTVSKGRNKRIKP